MKLKHHLVSSTGTLGGTLLTSFLVLGASVVGSTSTQMNNSSSGSTNQAADTPFIPVSAPQGPREPHSLHLLVPSASVVGCTSPPIKILHLGLLTELLIPHLSM